MLQPYFLDTSEGQVFVQTCVPVTASDEAVIIVPPFAEEMNKSRRMMALLASSLAAKGVLTAIPDLYGTGDSEGDFSDARWSIWLENLEKVTQRLKEQGIKKISLLGLRMGCLLINDFLLQQKADINKVIFWKPVISGKQMINQFLRLRVANSMMEGGKESTDSLRELLAQEGVLEVAGYSLNQSLISSIDGTTLLAETFDSSIKWHWFEVLATENQPIPMASSKITQALEGLGVDISIQRVVGESFWANQEIAEVPELIAVSCDAICESGSDGSQ